MGIKEQILQLLENDSRLTHKEIAMMLDLEESAVDDYVREMEEDRIICGYHTIVNWEKTNDSDVSAIVEVRVNPQRGQGFDRIAEKIYQFPEVQAIYLISGSYDFSIELKKAPMRDIANFVSSRLSIIEEVQSTSTNIILKKYKDHGTLFVQEEGEQRLAVSP
ncbi:Lrp/AsnC family transcriptional regulator [Fundicoccus culcitae]|uniref:Lrp/AsnC family transcriptional regulator n=1 Tax=Fundicoccus culcitae TaxID=2969821 RepID=A0ABY5PA23_9LACT|nr:Lrp/AsnC family transcriptional regulator [Fundicoccus culcitae]UUX35330.1 Lrp/AsnC family transcriptional regulator [Fundicoccus culcitae]